MKARAFVVASALLVACEARPSSPTPIPTPSPAAAPEPEAYESLVEAECSDCHGEVAGQWDSSRHHHAFDNAAFTASYRREPQPFCRDCHAPAFTRAAEVPAKSTPAFELAAARGVGCLDCHADPKDPDRVRTTGPAAATSTAPHRVTFDPNFGTEACASCHEFAFPSDSGRPLDTMMQTTMREHAASDHAERSCASCHMPGSNHAFASTRDPGAMRAALDVDAHRGELGVVFELRPQGVGHAFPTGDLFRRLELGAELLGPDGEVLATATRYLDREFARRRLPDGQFNPLFDAPVPDDRLTGPTQIELELPLTPPGPLSAAPEAVLHWWVDYERVDARNHLTPARSTLADELRLAEGRLPASLEQPI